MSWEDDYQKWRADVNVPQEVQTKPNLIRKPLIEELTEQPYERYLPNAFDESLSLIEKINKVIYHISQSDTLSSELITKWNEFSLWVNTEFNDDVKEKIKQELTDEKIEQLTSQTITRLIENELGDINSQLENVNKKTSLSVTDFEHLVINKGFLSEDWKPAIQAAINTLPSTGGEIIFPDRPGKTVYKMRSPITISDKSNVKLKGTGSTQLEMNVNTSDVIKIYASSYQRNITIENINIIYPVGSTATTGRAIVIETASPTISIQRILIRNMRIDNPGHGIYMVNVPLWFSDFEDLEVTGSFQSGYTLRGGNSIGRLATVSMRRCYVTNMTTINPAFVIKDAYHILLEQCQADYSSKFGDFKVRGLTLRDCGAEAIDIDNLPEYHSVIDIANETGVDWGVIIENIHLHMIGTTNATQPEKYLIRSFSPLKIKGFRLFGGGGSMSEDVWNFPERVHFIRCDGDFVHEINGVSHSWNGGGKISSTKGTLILKNISSKITDKSSGTGDLIEYTNKGLLLNNKITKRALSKPIEGVWKRGDIIYKDNPTPNDYMGWICTSSGDFSSTPPIFKGFGLIEM